jgi:glutamate dehydrogenase/leucine dehydrogenase
VCPSTATGAAGSSPVAPDLRGQRLPEVLGGLDVTMTAAINAVTELARKQKLFMRDAAYVLAVTRVAKACQDRGWV